ncbi:MAG: four helix bundle protein [Candidatus Brocadia sp.]|nr:four helix bundle protein [Candidatus Brocadia sp.]
MATIRKFEDVDAWQKAREFSKESYSITNNGLISKDYDLKGQMRQASGSIMDNVAEGFERGRKGEFIQFLGIAKGSCGEVRSQLYRALDQGYISKMIKGLITYFNNTEIKGQKYKK